jgi:hypothetical protein
MSAFLRIFRIGCDRAASCAAAGITPWTVASWRRTDPRFARAYSEAPDGALDGLEALAFARARVSDRVLIWLLASHRPAQYSIAAQVGKLRERQDERPAELVSRTFELWDSMQAFCPPENAPDLSPRA